MTASNERLHEAFRSYAMACLRLMADMGDSLPISYREEFEWEREPDGQFTGHQVFLPEWGRTVSGLRNAFADTDEYRQLAEAAREDAVVSSQLDVMVGVERARMPTSLESLLYRFLAALLERQGGPDFDEYAFDLEYGRLEQSFYSDEVPWTAAMPLLGLTAPGRIILAPGLELRALSREELRWVNSSQEFSDHGYPLMPPVIALVAAYNLRKIVGDRPTDTGSPVRETYLSYRQSLDRALAGLALLKHGHFRCPVILERSSSYLFPVSHHVRPRSTFTSDGRLEILEEERTRLLGLYDSLGENSHPGVAKAIGRFVYGVDRKKEEDRLVDLMVGAESLFLPKEKDELAFKLCLRAALLWASLGLAGRSPTDVYQSMKKAYRLRSAIVHGAGRADPNLKETTLAAEEIMRQTITACLTDPPVPIPRTPGDWDKLTATWLERVGQGVASGTLASGTANE